MIFASIFPPSVSCSPSPIRNDLLIVFSVSLARIEYSNLIPVGPRTVICILFDGASDVSMLTVLSGSREVTRSQKLFDET